MFKMLKMSKGVAVAGEGPGSAEEAGSGDLRENHERCQAESRPQLTRHFENNSEVTMGKNDQKEQMENGHNYCIAT